jgi:hypothetical protein
MATSSVSGKGCVVDFPHVFTGQGDEGREGSESAREGTKVGWVGKAWPGPIAPPNRPAEGWEKSTKLLPLPWPVEWSRLANPDCERTCTS